MEITIRGSAAYYYGAVRRIDDLIDYVHTLPETRKRATTVRYLRAARANMVFLYQAVGGGQHDDR